MVDLLGYQGHFRDHTDHCSLEGAAVARRDWQKWAGRKTGLGRQRSCLLQVLGPAVVSWPMYLGSFALLVVVVVVLEWAACWRKWEGRRMRTTTVRGRDRGQVRARGQGW